MSNDQLLAPLSLRAPGPRAVAAAAEPPGGSVPAGALEPILDANEIQGNIWPGFNTAHIGLLGFRIIPGEEQNARRWLRELAPLITTLGEAWHAREVRRAVAKATGTAPLRPNIFLNLALSFDALPLLGLPVANIPAGAFRSGMAAANLQDAVDAAGIPTGWKIGATPQTTPHIFIITAADDPQSLSDSVNILKS